MNVHLGNHYSNGKVIGVGENYIAINNDTLLVGLGFKQDDILRRRNVAIIGQSVVEDIFGNTTEFLGREIRIDGRKYAVIGVLNPKSRDFLASIGSGGDDPNKRILIPYTVLQLQYGKSDINSIQAEAIEYAQADVAVSQVISVLEHRHNRQFSYRSTTMSQYIETANRILQGVSVIGMLAASISLLVGGMGIMNIVSTSVLERTREIGLRKAVGATRRHILLQFLMESVILSGAGGAIGLLLGVLASIILAWITGFPLMPSVFTVVSAFIVSVGVGLLSGYYPARRAANLRPVVALRYE
jgi:putative ABC transport system permease protein